MRCRGAGHAARGRGGGARGRARERIAARNRERREAAREAAQAGDGAPMSAGWISYCLDRVKDEDAILFNELGADPGV